MRDPKRSRLEGYLGRLYGYAISLGNDRELARDLVQECALKALSARRVPRDEPAYRAWLFRILRNAFLDRARRNGELSLDGEVDEADIVNGELWHADDRLISGLTVQLGLAKLTPAHREIIAVVDIVGFTYAEAADFLGVPEGTVMSRLSRARQALLLAITNSTVRPLPVNTKRAVE